MSADRQRLTSAIRRIAKTDPEIRGLLDAADNKGGKPGATGVGSSTDAESQRICCDGSVSDNANPGTDTRDTTDGDQAGLDPNDPADLGGLDGGCLTGVTNCDTGEAVCFCGDGFIPPDGWDAPDDPPVEEYYDENEYYQLRDGGGSVLSESNSCSEIANEFIALQVQYCGFGPSVDDICGTTSFGNIRFFSCSGVDRGVYRLSCTSSPSSTCDDPPPTADSWPSDSCVNLAVKSGTIVGSKYDPENDGSYSAPRSEIHLCDGTDDIYLKPSADGGWKSIDSTKTSGYLYGSDFKLIAHIDGNEYSDPSI